MAGTGPGTVRVAAVDLGASSGRVVVGTIGPDRLDLEEVHRFPNGPVAGPDGSLRWDVEGLYAAVLEGLRLTGPVDGIGIDTWAVDYGLLDGSGRLIAQPFCYRDGRTAEAVPRVHRRVPPESLYAATGLQFLPFNTIYQLASEPALDDAATMLLIPDLIAHRLTGVARAEVTNASTTGLLDARTRGWADKVIEQAGIRRSLLPDLVRPGEVIGPVTDGVAAAVGLASGTPVVAVGSHDTASAVVGVPAAPRSRYGYISSGTWSLVGVELDEPVITEAARRANFTNEAGVDGSVRFLHNVMGLWVLSETMRAWGSSDLAGLLAAAAELPVSGPVVDLDDPVFMAPGNMTARIDRACASTGQQAPATRAALVRCIVDSLAGAYARAVRTAAELSGRPIEVLHVVGGGARNALLCQLTADACGLPVLAGPVEATALGNVLVQARALGVDLPDLDSMRDLLRRTQSVVRYDPATRSGAG